MGKKSKVALVIAALCIIVGAWIFFEAVERNDDQNFQIKQALNGDITVRDTAGYYYKGWAEITTYPRVMRAHYSSEKKEGETEDDESISVTFNDGGTADINTYIQFRMPIKDAPRKEMHRTFGGNPKNIVQAVRAHLVNCLKTASPLMSSSEHQSARKGEYNQIVEDQMKRGLFVTRRIEKGTGIFDQDGKEVMALVTEIVIDEKGLPRIAQVSPLETYQITIDQFSITSTKYDKETLEQFRVKKKTFLEAEKAKAEKSRADQDKLRIVAVGQAEKAEVEAEANKKKAAAVIAAELKAEVAIQASIEAVTKAKMAVSVAEQDKLEAETNAQKLLAVAKLRKEAAVEEAKAIEILAAAEEIKIAKAGAITETVQILAEINAKRDVEVAKALAGLRVPTVIMTGGGGDGKGEDVMSKLINMRLLIGMGILDKDKDK